MSGLHNLEVVETSRHALLELALGAYGAIARLEALLERHAPATDAEPVPSDFVGDDVALVLGSIAIAVRLRRALDVETKEDAPGERPVEVAEEWLR